jgi:hypothetical protein
MLSDGDSVAYERQKYGLIGSIKVSADWPLCNPWQKVSIRENRTCLAGLHQDLFAAA